MTSNTAHFACIRQKGLCDPACACTTTILAVNSLLVGPLLRQPRSKPTMAFAMVVLLPFPVLWANGDPIDQLWLMSWSLQCHSLLDKHTALRVALMP